MSRSTDKIVDLSNERDTQTPNKTRYPKHVLLIVINEFCERFSFYGFRTVLYIFFTKFLNMQEHTATAYYHGFAMLCYFTPILGAILADGYIGLYKTIISLSIFYAFGEILLTLTSMVPLGAPNKIGPLIGLAMIGIGTGGIKPCVSAFGGNQFQSDQKEYIPSFFSLFYLSINVGSTIGTLVTPIFRSDIKCFGQDCYPLAFGVPALLMLLAVIVFAIGTPYYRRDNDKPKGSGNIISMTMGCIFLAIRNKIKSLNDTEKKEHWLDYADDGHSYSKKMVSDVKIFCKVVLVFLPLPLFWALYDQQGSRWTSQAQQLNGRVGSWTIKPDQFQAFNPILIVLLVPIFDMVLYPLFAKCGLLRKQLQRMSVGLIFTVISFLISAFLEHQMDLSALKLNPVSQIKIINVSPCQFNMIIPTDNTDNEMLLIKEASFLHNRAQILPQEFVQKLNITGVLRVNGTCKTQTNEFSIEQDLSIDSLNLPKNVIVSFDSLNKRLTTTYLPYSLEKPEIGISEMKINSFNLDNNSSLRPIISNDVLSYDELKIQPIGLNLESNYFKLDYNEYKLKVLSEDADPVLVNEILLETCTKYTILLFPTPSNDSIDYVLLTDVYSSGIHLGWQLIQISVITAGEVMFSISGLSFAYSEAPQSMKSVISAVWLLTVAVGNLVVVIIAESRFVSDQVHEYLLFAGLLTLATAVFIILAIFYQYTDESHEENSSTENASNNTEDAKLCKDEEARIAPRDETSFF